MLKLTSRFVLEVLPYLLSAMAVAALVPAFLWLMTVALPGVFYSEAHETEAVVTPTLSNRAENAVELIHRDHDAFAPNQGLLGEVAKAAKDDLVSR